MQGTPETCPDVALQTQWMAGEYSHYFFSREENRSMKRTLSVIVILTVLGLVLGGCASPEQRAQKLFDQGKYEEILQKYADLPIAKQAKDKVAEKMLAEGKYEEILKDYADTPSAADATNKIAEKLVAEKKYDEVLARYPQTPAANMARNAMAEQLYADKKTDELIQKFPNTPAGVKARNELAKTELDKIMKMAKKAKQAKLEEFLKNPKFAGTESSMKAKEELDKLTKKPEPKKAVKK
jgi:hypothetical protein